MERIKNGLSNQTPCVLSIMDTRNILEMRLPYKLNITPPLILAYLGDKKKEPCANLIEATD